MTDFADVITDINLIPNFYGVHSGFADVANDFTRDCDKIKFSIEGKTVSLADMILDMKNEGSKYQLLVTGHSLGGAVADVFVAQNLVNFNNVDPSNVVAYTFAAARSVSSSYSYDYHNIINIINADDIVPTIGGSQHIGDNIVYTPDDTFRKANYGSNYVGGHTSAWWTNAVDSAKTGFVAHKLKPVYNSIIDAIQFNLSDYTEYNTISNQNWFDSVTINQNCFGKIEGDLETNDSLVLENGSLEVTGNATISKLDMTHDMDYLLVDGNLEISGGYDNLYNDCSKHLSSGTVELKGDFKSIDSSGYYGYYETGEHKTVFSGNKTQKISFASNYGNNRFENLILKNENINFATPISYLKLCEDTVITSEQPLVISNTLDLNGFTLQANNVIYKGGDMVVQGKNNKIIGNFTTIGRLVFNKGYLEITGDCSLGTEGNTQYCYLSMTHESDYLLVDGNFTIGYSPLYATKLLTAGIVEVKGNFKDIGSSSCETYRETDNHKTILSGNDVQTVTIVNKGGHSFANLVLENISKQGVVFESPILVTNLFNHNQNKFTLYNSGKGSNFPDYDGDGLKDSVDPYPLIAEHTHTWDNGKVTKVATCTVNGTKIFTCTVCKETKTETIKATGHKAVTDKAVPATCTTAGKTAGSHCSVCNAVITAQKAVPAIGHSYDAGRVTKKVTCTANGIKTYTCTKCNATKTETIKATGHKAVTDKAVAATCTTAGKTAGSHCSVCNTVITAQKTVPATGHSYDKGKVTKKATCKATGVKTYTCTKCKATKTETIKAIGHSYDKGKVTKKATCKATGVKTFTCTKCKATKTESIAKAAHTYKTTTTKATTKKNGTVVKKCSVCGTSTKTTIYYPKTITLSATSYSYDGKVKKPSVTVKDSKGKKIAASNYTVTYASGRKNVGTYKITIKFKGNYSGTVTKTFTIKPKATTVSKVTAASKAFTVSWKKQATQTTGYEIQYSTDKNFKKNNKTVTVSKNSTTSKKITKLTGKKKYYVRIRTYKIVGKTKLYSNWSASKTVTTKK